MARWVALVAAVWGSVVGSASGQTRQAIFIDRSGSTRAYYQDRVIPTVSRTLLEALQPEGEVVPFAFSTAAAQVKDLGEIDSLPFGQSTYLDRTVERALGQNFSIAWIITDNIQDAPGDPAAGFTEAFYRRLRTDAVRRVTIFPLVQPSGRPGLVIYALLLDDTAADHYQKGLTEFQQRARGILRTDALRMKPLDRDTVQVSFVRANVNARTSKITYSTGVPVREKLEIRFKSFFDHLEIADARIQVVQGEPVFDSRSLLLMERRAISIDPQKVARLAAGDETEQVYQVDIDLGKLRLKKDVGSLWRAAWSTSGEDAVLRLAFLIEVPQQNFQLRGQFLRDFHAASLAEARATGRVYALDQLPRLMSEDVTAVRVESPLVFRVSYPWWPSLAWLLAFLVAAALVGTLITVAARIPVRPLREWDVQATTDHGAPVDASCENGAVMVQGDRVGTIDKNVFAPAGGVVLESGADRAQVSAGLKLNVRSSRRSLVLRFDQKKAAPDVAAAYVPRRR